MSDVGASQQFSMQVDPGLAGRRVRHQLRDQLPGEVTSVVAGAVLVVAGMGWPSLLPLFVASATMFVATTVARIVRVVSSEISFVRLHFPVGSNVVVTFAADHLVLRGTMEESFVPYAGIGWVRRRGHFVEVYPKAESRFLLPAEICPPAVEAKLAEAIESATPATVPAMFTNRALAGEVYAKATSRYATRNGVVTLGWLLPVIGWALIAIAAAVLGKWIGVLVPVVSLVMLGLTAVNTLQSWRSREVIEMRTRFDDDGFVFSDSDSAVKWAYELFDRVRVHPAVVELRDVASHVWSQYPRELFPDAELDRFARGGVRVS